MKTKVLYKFRTSKTKGVEIKTEKATKCVQSIEHVKSYVYLILSHTEHPSTMLSVNQTPEYHWFHEDKSTVQVWSFKDKECRNKK